jgi:mono/diheme cytochrome c family protein
MLVRVAASVALALGALAVTGCGAGTGGVITGGDASRGKELFIKGENGKPSCATCHTLRDAVAAGAPAGKVGPDLDAAFGSDRAQGFKESTIRQVVADQIKFAGQYGTQGPTMPQNLVTGEAVDDVAAYVASVAGRPAGGGGQSTAPGTTQQTTTQEQPAGGGAASAAAGKKAFADNGCGACHTLAAAGSSGAVGPDLDKLKSYAQAAGMPLEDFIRESIVKPNAYVEKGYPQGVMPQNFSQLPPSTLNALVAFLAASAKG